MKIYVEKVLDEVVYFSTDYGKAKGIWKGNNRPFNKVWEVSSHSEERDTDSPSKKGWRFISCTFLTGKRSALSQKWHSFRPLLNAYHCL